MTSSFQNIAISMEQFTPPSSPNNFDTYIIPDSDKVTGIWDKRQKQIAYYNDSKWHFINPKTGMCFYVLDKRCFYIYCNNSNISHYQWNLLSTHKILRFLPKLYAGSIEVGSYILQKGFAGISGEIFNIEIELYTSATFKDAKAIDKLYVDISDFYFQLTKLDPNCQNLQLDYFVKTNSIVNTDNTFNKCIIASSTNEFYEEDSCRNFLFFGDLLNRLTVADIKKKSFNVSYNISALRKKLY